MALAVFRERLVDLRVRFESFRPASTMRKTPEREDRALEGLIGLKANDHLVIAIDIAGLMGKQRRRRFRIDGENAFLLLLLDIGLEFFPDRLCAFGRAYEECLIPFAR